MLKFERIKFDSKYTYAGNEAIIDYHYLVYRNGKFLHNFRPSYENTINDKKFALRLIPEAIDLVEYTEGPLTAKEKQQIVDFYCKGKADVNELKEEIKKQKAILKKLEKKLKLDFSK